MRALSDRQRQAFQVIRQFIASHGCSPTFREVGERMGCSSVMVKRHVEALMDAKLIRYRPHARRAIEIVDQEPTEAMIEAGVIELLQMSPEDDSDVIVRAIWRAMKGAENV